MLLSKERVYIVKDDMKEKVANFILDFQARNRQVRDAREAEIIQTEQIRSVMRGASALVEANIPREQSVFLLQKSADVAKRPHSDCSMGSGRNTGVRSSQQAQQV